MMRQKTTVRPITRPGKSYRPKKPGAAVPLPSPTALAGLVEFSNDAIFSGTLDGIIQSWNPAAERIFGFKSDKMIGKSSRVLLPPGRGRAFQRLLAQIRGGKIVEPFETEWIGNSGRVCVTVRLLPLTNASGRSIGFAAIARELTVWRELRGAVAQGERELEDLFEEASIGLAMVARDGTVLRVNRALTELVGWPAARLAGHSLEMFHPNTALLKHILRRLAQRQTFHNFPTELLNREGEIKSVLVDANVFWQDGTFIHSRWFVRDISRRKRLERELLEISERERRRFAQELHDGLGQQLGGIAYLSNVMREKLLERGAPEAGDAARVSNLMRNAIEQVRRVARGLSPIQPEPEGLSNALAELALQSAELFGVRCVFQCRQPVLIHDPELAAHLFRIAQEAINNALKHAKPRSIRIRLVRAQGRITLAVFDDGQGIAPVSPKRKGLGLRIMQYRSGLIHGALTVRRRPVRGTEVICSAPCHPPRKEESLP